MASIIDLITYELIYFFSTRPLDIFPGLIAFTIWFLVLSWLVRFLLKKYVSPDNLDIIGEIGALIIIALITLINILIGSPLGIVYAICIFIYFFLRVIWILLKRLRVI